MEREADMRREKAKAHGRAIHFPVEVPVIRVPRKRSKAANPLFQMAHAARALKPQLLGLN